MAAQSIQPQNAFFTMLVALQQAQDETRNNVGTVATALGEQGPMSTVLGGISTAVSATLGQQGPMATALGGVSSAIAAAAQKHCDAVDAQSAILTKIANSAERQTEIMATRLMPELDAPAAWLYAAGVDRDGTFNRSSLVGEFLLKICGREELRALVARRGRNAPMSRQAFIDLAMDAKADRRGLPPDLTEYDFGRFYDLAQRVHQIAEANPTPPPPGT
jgi:hypothetical protein